MSGRYPWKLEKFNALPNVVRLGFFISWLTGNWGDLMSEGENFFKKNIKKTVHALFKEIFLNVEGEIKNHKLA
jgi:hypothetical protein